MEVIKEKTFFYIRILISLSIIGLWSKWIISLPRLDVHETPGILNVKNFHGTIHKKSEVTSRQTDTEKALSEGKILPLITSKEKDNTKQNKLIQVPNNLSSNIKSQKTTTIIEELTSFKSNNPLTDSTKKTNLLKIQEVKSPLIKEVKSISQDLLQTNRKIVATIKPQENHQTIIEDDFSLLALPKVAGETRNILVNESLQAMIISDPIMINLRKEIPLNMNSVNNAGIANNQNDKVLNNWLPKYIAEKKDIVATNTAPTNNIEQVLLDLEPTEIINSPLNASRIVKLRDRTNNKVETLKEGDVFRGLKLIEVKKDELVFLNESIKKTYIKKLSENLTITEKKQ